MQEILEVLLYIQKHICEPPHLIFPLSSTVFILGIEFWGYIYVIYRYTEKHMVFSSFFYFLCKWNDISVLFCSLLFSLTFVFVMFPCQYM